MRFEKKDVDCPSYMVNHPIESDEERVIILLTSSTLHNVILNDEVRVPFHIDIESISGARLMDLYNAWRTAYANVHKPQDLIIIAGLNDRVLPDTDFAAYPANNFAG